MRKLSQKHEWSHDLNNQSRLENSSILNKIVKRGFTPYNPVERKTGSSETGKKTTHVETDYNTITIIVQKLQKIVKRKKKKKSTNLTPLRLYQNKRETNLRVIVRITNEEIGGSDQYARFGKSAAEAGNHFLPMTDFFSKILLVVKLV